MYIYISTHIIYTYLHTHTHLPIHIHIYMCLCAYIHTYIYMCVCIHTFPLTTLIQKKVSWVTNNFFPCRNVSSSTSMNSLRLLFPVYLFMFLLILVFESQIFSSALVFSIRMLGSPLFYWNSIFSLKYYTWLFWVGDSWF